MDQSQFEQLKALLPECLLTDRYRLEARLGRLQTRRLPEQAAQSKLKRWIDQAHASIELRRERLARVPRPSYPEQLPITSKKEEIIAAIQAHQVVIVAGETGSGKTTQIPKMCLDAGCGQWGRIGCTQPRRIAALSVSRRIAEELDREWGEAVGCKIRFTDHTRPLTSLKVMTDGMLLAEVQGDPLLSEYEVLILDEAHERSLNIDFLLGYLKNLLPKRPELKLIISSATIDTETFSQAFGGAPILEVSGRLFPVEVEYAPLDEASEEEGELTYVDASVQTAERVWSESAHGDLLIFMPGERDIRETRDQLQGRLGDRAEIFALFGRLSAGDQQKVFATGRRRKIIIATNIAETSLTIPGIRFVIDTGLARISRYSPRTRTQRLPVEPISQASANQRKGRSGRVQNGVCIRLYSEEDFLSRPEHTQPEIQRSNLAEVILRMKASGLGEIETFPFINPPRPQAIRSGYQLLQELGALDPERHLTPLGRDLARLPIDPIIGRMILQSQKENALKEVLVIAAGLSIQDPRERPMDQQEAADQAHRKFLDPDSDFLTLLHLWNAYHEQWEKLKTQNQLRKFCKTHFLSYPRMREWRDIHAQLQAGLKDIGQIRWNEGTGTSEAVHRSILTGLLGHVGQKLDRNVYRASGNRTMMIFPGSVLFDRRPSKKKKAKQTQGKDEAEDKEPQEKHQPMWIMAGEMVETTRLFARTVACIQPEWIFHLGGHLCRSTYHDPHWNVKAGRVLVREKILFQGMEVHERKIPYSRVRPEEATGIFIREALIAERIQPEYPFLRHNREVRRKIESIQTRLRQADLPDVEEALFEFYRRSLGTSGVASVPDLNRFLRDPSKNHPDILCLKEEDLIGGRELAYDQQAFPDHVQIGDRSVPLVYVYAPGEPADGVTLKLPVRLLHLVTPDMPDWFVPGLREDQIECWLRSLPKSQRRQLMPLQPKVKEIVAALDPGHGSLAESVSRCIQSRYGVSIPPETWQREAWPVYLQPRVELVDSHDNTVDADRDLRALQLRWRSEVNRKPAAEWEQAVRRWERHGLTAWNFGDLPEQIEVSQISGMPVYAYPGLQVEDGYVSVRLFREREEACLRSREGFQRLAELAFQRELGWLQKDLKALDRFKDLYVTLGPAAELKETAYIHLMRFLFQRETVFPLTTQTFEATLHRAKERLPGMVPKFMDQLEQVLKLRQQVLLCRRPFAGMQEDLSDLMPRKFLLRFAYEQLPHLQRYLKAMLVRAERAGFNPAKDRDKARLVQPYREALRQWEQREGLSLAGRQMLDEYRWMVEEYKVACFAQELGTVYSVSPQRLNKKLEALQGVAG